MKDNITFLINQSLLYFRNSDLNSAEKCLKQVLNYHKKNTIALRLLGIIAAQRKKYNVALEFFFKALSFSKNDAIILSNIGNVYYELNDYEKALYYYNNSLKHNELYEEAWSNKANVLYKLNLFNEALFHYEKALSLSPTFFECWSNKGNTLFALNRYEEALRDYQHAISLKPDFASAWLNKANTLLELKRYKEAITDYKRALSLDPELHLAFGNYVHAMLHICDWSNFNQINNGKVLENINQIHPFVLLSLVDDPEKQKACSINFSLSSGFNNKEIYKIKSDNNDQKKSFPIKIGYFSADFYSHATSYLISELFELHDKEKFELYAFSFGKNSEDGLTNRLKNSFSKFIDVRNISDHEVKNLCTKIGIDIAVDLKGHTQHARTGIFALRAAPIQVNYLGFPGTIGSNCMDYIIADRITIPIANRQYFSEKVAYLPDCYQVNDRKREISDKKLTRKDFNLPESGFVFCCFNNSYKITPTIFDHWINILKQVDGSVLWLLQDNIWATENLMKEARIRGLDSNRIIFAERMILADHLARHRLADLFLDTFPYNAHTTASDALWAGLPILSLAGNAFPSRVASSLLSSVGLNELITQSGTEYQALAIELALNKEKLSLIRNKLIQNRLNTPLFDTELFTKNIETAYLIMYEKYKKKLIPDHIVV